MTSWLDPETPPSGIYGVYCRTNGKWYVGQAQNIRRRNQEEKRELNTGHCHNKHLQNAWNKYGSAAFTWVVLARCPVEDLNDLEIMWIKRLNSYENGFNMTTGGGGSRGYRHTPEWKAQARERNSDGKSPRKGQPISAEAKARMRAKVIGGKSPKAIAVYQLTKTGERLALFASISDAERTTGVSGAHISEVCREVPKRKTAGGFIWRWAGGTT